MHTKAMFALLVDRIGDCYLLNGSLCVHDAVIISEIILHKALMLKHYKCVHDVQTVTKVKIHY